MEQTQSHHFTAGEPLCSAGCCSVVSLQVCENQEILLSDPSKG